MSLLDGASAAEAGGGPTACWIKLKLKAMLVLLTKLPAKCGLKMRIVVTPEARVVFDSTTLLPLVA
jgi:hypothetical protein